MLGVGGAEGLAAIGNPEQAAVSGQTLILFEARDKHLFNTLSI